MSKALLPAAGLRWWDETELNHREMATRAITELVKNNLTSLNPAWNFMRVEAPMLVPASMVSPEYGDDDLWRIRAQIMGEDAAMRPETTAGSYLYAKKLANEKGKKAFPLCVWQVGKSYRREKNDGASASKLRFYEFTQLEYQCIYAKDTKADYRAAIEIPLREKLQWLCYGCLADVVSSDRLPSYSKLTNDIEIELESGKKVEVCSISTRIDFSEDHEVLEIAVGLDRIVDIAKMHEVI